MDTPISVLQEFCFKYLNGISPDYQLMSVEGVVHSPTFCYRVQIGGIVTSSMGNSKKKAKHGAALSALQMLVDRSRALPEIDYFDTKMAMFDDETIITNPNEAVPMDQESNPVGKLQEICMKRRWRPPIYQTTEEVGLPHERIFTMNCDIEHAEMKVSVRGHGKSKKQAKRSAAQAMITRLEQLNIHYQPGHESGSRYSERSTQERTTHNPSYANHVEKTLDKNLAKTITSFYNSLGDDLNQELDAYLPVDDVQTLSTFPHASRNLKELADYIECKVKFDKMETKSPDVHACLATLQPIDSYSCPFPLLTGWGQGGSSQEAENQAALKTLQLFKTMRTFIDIQQ